MPRPNQPYAPYPADPYADAKFAGAWQFVLGGLGLASGLCIGILPWAVDLGRVIADAHVQLPAVEGMTQEQLLQLLKVFYTVVGGGMFLASAALTVLALSVRRASKGGTIASIVIAGLALVVMALFILQGLIALLSNPAQAAATLVMMAAPTALTGWVVMLLVKSLKMISKVKQFVVNQQQQWLAWQQTQMRGPAVGGWAYAPQVAQTPQQQLTPPPTPPSAQ